MAAHKRFFVRPGFVRLQRDLVTPLDALHILLSACVWKQLVVVPKLVIRWHFVTSDLSGCEPPFSIASLSAKLSLPQREAPLADGADVASLPFSVPVCRSSRPVPSWKVHMTRDKWKSTPIKVPSVTLLASPYGAFLARHCLDIKSFRIQGASLLHLRGATNLNWQAGDENRRWESLAESHQAAASPRPPVYLNSGLLNPDMKTYVNACFQFSNGDAAFIYANEIARARRVTRCPRGHCRVRLLAPGCRHGRHGFGRLCPAPCWAPSFGPPLLSGALDHFRCFDGSLKWRGADYRGCRDHTPQMTPSATDHQVGRDRGVTVEGCDNISRQLSLEQRCGAILTLDFPQVMTSSVSDSRCPRNLFPSPPLMSHHPQAEFVSFSQTDILQGRGINF